MSWQSIFAATNGIALIGWLLLLLAPRRPLTLSLVLYAAVGLLCLIYAVLLFALIGGAIDPVRAPGAEAASLTDYSVRGLRAMFASDGAITVGWTHYLALDLFTGLWIARDADGKGVARFLQAPVLLVTYMAGPLGLLIWLVAREPLARRRARAS
nr:abscisic acid-deficient protein Aba4 family protein [uncultured Sphingosinicella sp.]